MKRIVRKSSLLSVIFVMWLFCSNAYAQVMSQDEIANMKYTEGYILESISADCCAEVEDWEIFCDECGYFETGEKVYIVGEEGNNYHIRWQDNGRWHIGSVAKSKISTAAPKMMYVITDTYMNNGKIKKNQQVKVVGEFGAEYYIVNAGDNSGYIHKNLLSDRKSTVVTKYTTDYTKVYESPSNKGLYFITLDKGSPIDVVSGPDKNGYYKVLMYEEFGYIKADYLGDIKPVLKYALYDQTIYKKSGRKGGKIGKIAQNDEIEIIGARDKKGYCRVYLSGRSGYIKATGICEAPVDTAYSQIKLNVFSKKNGKGKVGTIKANSKLYVVQQKTKYDNYFYSFQSFVQNKYGYYKIVYKGKIRYAKAAYIGEKKSSTRYINYKGTLRNSKGKKICTLKFNTKVTFVYEGYRDDGKAKIIYRGKAGYIESWKLSKKKLKGSDKRRFSEATVMRKIKAMYSKYPEGMYWTNANGYAWKGGIFTMGFGCAGFAFHLSDAAFDNCPARIIRNCSNLKRDLRVGDIPRINGDTHSVIIIEKTDTGVVFAEGNYNSSIHWGRTMTYGELQSVIDYYITRYPN